LRQEIEQHSWNVSTNTGTYSTKRFWRAAWAVVRKDVRSELRTRYALNALAMFALTVVLVVSFYLGTRLSPRSLETPAIHATLIWIALFFTALTGLSRAFVHEEEAQTATLLRLHVPPLAVFVGKWLLNLALVSVVNVVVPVLLSMLLRMRIANMPMLLLALLLGGVGLATTMTLISAIIAKASARGALFAALTFPVVFPLLVLAITATEQALIGAPWRQALPQLQGLGAFAIATIAAAVLLFPFVWDA
jgi:heme exporter protein B